jgi:hypothetical protein
MMPVTYLAAVPPTTPFAERVLAYLLLAIEELQEEKQ